MMPRFKMAKKLSAVLRVTLPSLHVLVLASD